ncbi:sushi, von Willebrand factor type A, EGF and pentraxin domain-containing protein 1-like [Ruditapes philippinarum]|uniref:sushi, von Willebrand factor type A, EGF and pentraxin domain-containing protein 1-like n=1 Tax=Ruditapes philippinarum TaxID=129788 RepID=UPI00295C0732|nr:sushi, von Willebrand factor type A, EGF and pentraxin domain-containing protein 1-like [Ruditapes philippinarum]
MHSIGSRVKFRCNPGYVDVTNVDVTNVMNAVCEASGQWSYLPNCIRDCGTVPNIANAQVISGGVTTTEGAVVQYECLSGYSFNGNPGYLTCTADGIWFDQASVVCVPLISIGGSCSSHSDCTLTNGVCDGESGKCFCSPLYRYKPEINDCFQECTSFTSTFTAFANTGVYGYNALGSSSIDTPSQCEDLCRSDPNCLSFEVWEDDGSLRCNRGTVAYLNILDGDPGSVLTGESWITIYNRDCI